MLSIIIAIYYNHLRGTPLDFWGGGMEVGVRVFFPPFTHQMGKAFFFFLPSHTGWLSFFFFLQNYLCNTRFWVGRKKKITAESQQWVKFFFSFQKTSKPPLLISNDASLNKMSQT